MMSRFAPITSVVPGEADLFCALAARSKGALVFTNDSDLLLYDLGSRGAVCFLQSIQVVESHDSRRSTACHILTASVLHPRDITKRLGLQSLGHLAFQINRDSHVSFNTAIRRAVEKPTADAVTWLQKYDVQKDFRDASSLQENSLPQSLEHYLDPRVSELVLRTKSNSEARDGLIFLPLLLEDPFRTSAWVAARPIRMLGYQCLDIRSDCLPFTLTENVGRESASVVEIVGLSNAGSDTEIAVVKLLDEIEGARKTCHGIGGDILFWRVFALMWTHTWLTKQHKKAPSESDIAHTLCGSKGEHRTWSFIHLMAQVHGVLYSLSMLRQILVYNKAVQEQVLSSTLQKLVDTLCGLPALSELLISDRELGQHMAKYRIENILSIFSQAIHEE